MVMHPQVAPWGKRHFGGSHFVLIVKFGQVAEDNLLDFHHRRDAPCFHFLLEPPSDLLR